MGRILVRRQEVVRVNLKLAFPEKTDSQREKILRGHFEHLGRVALDMLLQPYFRFAWILNLRLQRIGWEHLEAAQKGGQSTLLLCSHMGSWEMCAAVSLLPEVELLSVYKKSQGFGDAFLLALRQGFPQTLLSKRQSKRELLRGARRGALLGLIADQGGLTKYDFFGHPAYFPDGPGHFWGKFGTPPVFCLAIRQPGGVYHCHCLPLELPERDSLPPEERRPVFVRAYIQELERWIRKYPEQYYWVHDVWRSFKDD
jgi:KDO2-lipid IV(A) lauroyltransferase